MLAWTPLALILAALLVTGTATWRAWRARRHLSVAVRNAGRAEHVVLSELLGAGNLDGAASVLRAHFKDMPEAERRDAESALSQPSRVGRNRYIRGVAGIGASEAFASPSVTVQKG